MLTTVDVVVTALVGLSIFWLLDRQRRQNKHLPPGPKGLPFIGNLLQIPREKECVAFKEMGDAHGNVWNNIHTWRDADKLLVQGQT